MLELKDAAAIGIAIIAAGISFRAMWVANRSYKLARDIDRRNLEAKRPHVDPQPPTCDGFGLWQMPIAIRNRADVPVVIERFGVGPTSDVCLQGGGDFYSVVVPESRTNRRTFYLDVSRELAIGETITLQAALGVAEANRRVPTDGVLTLVVRFHYRDEEAVSQDLTIRRVLNAR